ncbi:uncharacterized protein METZ01_LOCUS149738 [marine metagenome]|uniref:LPP20 lipoprotein n=1 Tax=marine metagenome TaxID=408172 RepID=A0A382A644_9ZZZZ
MKHLIIFLGIGLLISSCAAPPKAVKTGSEIGETPEWVQTMGRYDKGEGAIGSSPKSGLGSQPQREDAMLSARNALTQNIDIKVQSAISQTRQRLIEQGIAGAIELGTLQTQNAARQMVNQRLKNSRPIKQWKDPESEELYVWVIIEQVDLDRMAGDIHGKVIRKQLKDSSEEHSDTIKNTFDEEFDKQFSQ